MTTTDKYYCSQKFWFLFVDLAKKNQQSCCAARPEKISMQWLRQNPGKLFSTPTLIAERNSMLAGHAVDSCHDNCWLPEQRGLVSRRLHSQSDRRTHLDPYVDRPETLNIMLGTTCNLTCSYCCKQYSSSWYRDIDTNGSYFDHSRFKITEQEKIIHRLGHNDLTQSSDYQALLSELKHFKKVKNLKITGGEPFLYNDLPSLITQFDAEKIFVFSGLGVNSTRFKNQLDQIGPRDNLTITVSAENLYQMHEFNRYGSSFEQFNSNIQHLVNSGFKIAFNSVVSNLTIFGLIPFWKKFQDYHINYAFCNEPDWLSVNVLDSKSKDYIVGQLDQSSIPIRDDLLKVLAVNPTPAQTSQFAKYVIEFSRRRNLDLVIFPDTMVDWVKSNVV